MAPPTVAAIITAKGGNQSLPGKNTVMIGGLPSLAHPIWAARTSGVVTEIYVSTEDAEIANVARSYGAQVLDRPAELSRPDSNHGDVILHAAGQVAAAHGPPDIVTVLLGNTVMVEPEDIATTVRVLNEDPTLTSAMTVWVAQDDHPLRALRIDDDGLLRSYLDVPTPDTNRQSYPEAVFYDQGPWTVRYATLTASASRRAGPGPWWWMGDRCLAVKRQWVTGRDTHTDLDLAIAEWWLRTMSPGRSFD